MNWVSIGSGNGFSPVWRQAITWTNAGILSIGLLTTNFSENRIRILSFSFNKMHSKWSSAIVAAILSRWRWVNSLPLLRFNFLFYNQWLTLAGWVNIYLMAMNTSNLSLWGDARRWYQMDKFSRKLLFLVLLLGSSFHFHGDLTHLPLVPNICVSELGQHWFR